MRSIIVALLAGLTVPGQALPQGVDPPDTVTIASGSLQLRALLWRPRTSGAFPAILFNHGSYARSDSLLMTEAAVLGPQFVQHGYAFLLLFRRGVGLSADQDTAGGELMAQGFSRGGQAERNRIQLALMDGAELQDAIAGLQFLRTVPHVDRHRLAVVGHSFGGSLTLFLAARDTMVRAVVVFGAAAASWPNSPELRARLAAAVRGAAPPILFLHAANDYSIAPGKALAAERKKAGRAVRLKIFRAFGKTPREGHNFLYRDPGIWESAVFAFLEETLRP
jgi:dienelactone hydrolase